MDIRGGAHATLYTEALQNGEGKLDAICLAGGSFYGLEAATGVAAELLARHNYSPHWGNIALVSGAIIYDFGPRDNASLPRQGTRPRGAQSGGTTGGDSRSVTTRRRAIGDCWQVAAESPTAASTPVRVARFVKSRVLKLPSSQW